MRKTDSMATRAKAKTGRRRPRSGPNESDEVVNKKNSIVWLCRATGGVASYQDAQKRRQFGRAKPVGHNISLWDKREKVRNSVRKRPIVGNFLPTACIFCQLSFSVETSDIMNLKTGAVTRTMSCLA